MLPRMLIAGDCWLQSLSLRYSYLCHSRKYRKWPSHQCPPCRSDYQHFCRLSWVHNLFEKILLHQPWSGLWCTDLQQRNTGSWLKCSRPRTFCLHMHSIPGLMLEPKATSNMSWERCYVYPLLICNIKSVFRVENEPVDRRKCELLRGSLGNPSRTLPGAHSPWVPYIVRNGASNSRTRPTVKFRK